MRSFLCVTISILSMVIFTKCDISKEEIQSALQAVADTCKAEIGAADADFLEIVIKKPDSIKAERCLRECLMTKVKFPMIVDGKLSKPGMRTMAAIMFKDQDMLNSSYNGIDECAALAVSVDKCDAADEYALCLKQKADELGLVFGL